MNLEKKVLKWISEIQAIAQSGLAYTPNPFDKERFLRLRDLAAEMAADYSGTDAGDIKQWFSLEKGYATPKIDVRTFTLKDDKVLLVREKIDDLWTLPGGWIDINESPSESAIRETEEESGYRIRIIRLLALWDKLKHDHPPQWPHAYKCFFHGEIIDGAPKENLEISEIAFFALNQLPPLSVNRVTEKQLVRLYDLVKTDKPTQYD